MAKTARYYDGKIAVARDVGVRASAAELVLTDPGGTTVVARWPAAELQVLGDTEHEKAPPVVRKGEDGRLVIEDGELRHQLAQVMPVLAALGRPRSKAAPRIAMFGATLAAAVGLFWGAIEVGSSTLAPYVPYAWQHKLGESVAEELTGDATLCKGRAGLSALNGLANRLAKAADYEHPIEVKVVKGGPVNAFTLPGGVLIFYSDLIDKVKDGNELAGVMAHEIGHAVHYHSIKGLARQFGIDRLLSAMTGGFTDLGTVGQGGSLLLALRNGRAFERDADATGVALLQKLGLRADGIAGFFEHMMENNPRDAAAAIGIWSSHPPTAERIEATRQPATGRPAFTDSQWKSVQTICGVR